MAIDLNEEQKAIVEYDGDKFLSVQAGPGAGKTRVIVEKVKHMVKNQNVNPESLLIITFSTDAAEELKDRLIEGEISSSDVQKMQISTIHSFCLKILEETGNVGLDVVSEGEKLDLFIRKHLEDLGFVDEYYVRGSEAGNIIKKYNEYSTFKVKTDELVKYISENFPIADEYVEFVHRYMEENDGEFPYDELKEMDDENGDDVYYGSYKNAKYLQIARSYPKYLELLETENAIDYNQMQIKALEKMNEGYMPPYTNILIDEFQDTDPVQMDIFKYFIENEGTESFTVVGDINQSIYGFRGSNKNYFKELMRLYPEKFTEMYLATNYRSTEEIIDITQDFIAAHYDAGEDIPKAICGSELNNEVYFMVSEDKNLEAKNILNVIKYVMDEDRTIKNYSDIGILMRSVKSSSSCFKALTDMLDEEGIPYQVDGTGDLSESEELKYLLTLMYHLIQENDPYYTFVPSETSGWLNLKTLTGANDNEVLFELSDETKAILNDLQDSYEKDIKEMDKIVCSENEGWGRGIKKYSGIFSKATRRKDEVFSRVKKPILSDENLAAYGVTDQNDLDFFSELNKLKKEVNAEKYLDRPTVSDVYFRLLTDITGYLNEDMVNDKSKEAILYDLAKVTSSISTYGEVMYDRSLRGAFWFIKRVISKSDSYKPEEDAIQIMTVHKSKGLEFPVTILASVRDKGFPLAFKDPNPQSGFIHGRPTYYTPDEYLEYDRYENDDIEKAHIQEEERVIYVAKTRGEHELILSSIVKGSKEFVDIALENPTPENLKAIPKGPERIQNVIDENLDYCRLLNPDDVEMNVLEPREKSPKKEIVNLSFTALQNFKECPMKYKLANVFNFNVSQKKEIDAGIFIHRALEIINKKVLANNNEYIGDDEATRIVETLFEKANILLKEEQPEIYNDHLTSITADVLEYYNTIGNDLTILDSEYSFYLKDENYAFTGKIDLIYEKDGEIGIIDYKNTSLVGSEYLEKYSKQLHLYVMALRDENQQYHGKNIDKLNIYAIKYKKGDKLIPFEVDEDYIVALKKELQDVASQILAGEFEATCEDCEGCPYRRICGK